MLEPRRLTNLRALTACYRDSYTFISIYVYIVTCISDYRRVLDDNWIYWTPCTLTRNQKITITHNKPSA
jgi:hypothetical protein